MEDHTHLNNPFRPTFGVSPLIWSGRQTVLLDFEKALHSQPGNPGRSIIVSGSRGIGKTVLLNEVEDIARRNGWIVLRLSAREGMAQLLTDSLIPEAIEELEPQRKHHIEHISVAGVGSIGWNSDETQIAPRLTTRLRETGPDPRKVDTSGVSYAAWVSVAELSASKVSGARRLHQECRLR
ncbi:ATP-binding protein, partial [Corynebacterium tuscaniense]